MVGRPDLQSKVPHANEPEARWRGGQQHQEALVAVLPTQERALLIRAVPPCAKNRATPQCWWCRYQTLTREHHFKVSGVEGLAEDPGGEVRKETRR